MASERIRVGVSFRNSYLLREAGEDGEHAFSVRARRGPARSKNCFDIQGYSRC